MFTIPVDALLVNLEELRKQLCCYGSGPDGPCDCKWHPKVDLGNYSKTGEHTGCCEIRQAILEIRKANPEPWTDEEQAALESLNKRKRAWQSMPVPCQVCGKLVPRCQSACCNACG